MCSLSRSFRLSSTLRIEEEAMVITKNQGIGSILETSNNKSSSSFSSLRRTLSADMSSTKWLTKHGVSQSPMKKIASSEEFSICSIADSSSLSSSSEDDDDDDDDDGTEPRRQFDIWSSIIQQKSQQVITTDLPPPYIHPLVKRSAASSLTQKSLQICTESLGSETGSDGLISSYPSSESGDVTDDDDDKDMEQLERSVEQNFDNFEEQGSLPIYNYVKKSLQRRSFPPPMPSRSMQSRRHNGRLILESVSVSSTNSYFLAQRRDGRLVLTFANTIEQQQQQEEEEKEVQELFEEEFESFDDEDKESDDEAEEEEEEEEEEEAAFVMELQAPNVSSTVINLHRLTLMGLANGDTTLTTWPNKFNEVVKFDEVDEDIKPAILAKSLQPMARRLIPKSSAAGSGAASLNAYEYYWRPKPMATTQSKSNKKKNTQEEQQQFLLLLRGNKGENLVPWVKSCKEPGRSLLFWKPYCIATS